MDFFQGMSILEANLLTSLQRCQSVLTEKYMDLKTAMLVIEEAKLP